MIKILNKFFKENNLDISNCWIKFIIGCFVGTILIVLYFSLLFPILLNLQNNSISRQQETTLMYLIHSVYKNDSNITYFNMFPIIGGNRIFVVKADNDNLSEKFKNLDWKVADINNKKYQAVQKEYVAVFTEEKDGVLIVGCKDNLWSDFWYSIYEKYYF
ncbi:hypothetical protein [uncultured Phascolarctobacterium sp.]|uniref:hypothetical protein n=1 Tax=uncultured Phascolarctobacterium sp. TaxID=512296 RepID=UPI0025E66F6E|nr:hypothetical protein [uncultured Phascolarctobacterium sp.]